MNINIETLRKTKGIGQKTLERIIEQHEADNNIKTFKSEYIPSDKYTTDKDTNLWQGDCLDLMNHIPDKSIDLILADLPYGTTQCSWDEIIPFEPLWTHYKRIVKDNGVIVLFGSEPFSTKLRMSNLDWYKYDWIWEKSKATNFLNARKQPLRAYENVLVFYKGQPQYNPQMKPGSPYNKGVRKKQTTNDVYGSFKAIEVKSEGMRFPRDVLYYKTAESEGCVYHKTQKPVTLLEYLIKTYTNEGMIVLDNTMGSGSTGVACRNTNRRFVGIELDEEYSKIAQERINNIK